MIHKLLSNICAKLLIAWQILFAVALVCVTLFSVSASAEDVELRMTRFVEMQLQRQKERAVERAESNSQRGVLARIENNIEKSAEQQLQSAASRQLAQAVEDRVAVTVERQSYRVKRATGEFSQHSHLTAAEQLRRLQQIHNNPDVEAELEEQVVDTVAVEDILLQSFDPVEDTVTDTGADEVSDTLDQTVEDAISEPQLPGIDDISSIFRLEDLQMEQAETQVSLSTEQIARIEGNNVWTNEWIIMADAEAKTLLEDEGYQFSNEEHLESFDSIIASVTAPASYNLFDDYEVLMKKFNKHDAVIDMNHVYSNIYTNATNQSDSSVLGLIPGQLLSLSGKGIKIGMVDTAIDTDHALLKTANITQQHFTQNNNAPAFEHGTAVASVLVGESDYYDGIMTDAELVNASVFFESEDTKSITTAMSLLRGLNWLVKQDIQVINMSLAGPPNKLLQKGIEKLCDKGIVIVAAAGNNGPLSSPMYPAGYGCAVAVTAVDAERQLYKKAVRGQHIDIAAYGVDVMAAQPQNLVSAQSGTSIAAPFVSAWLASHLQQQDAQLASKTRAQWLENAFAQCEDLGESGLDPLYGHGLLPIDIIQIASLSQVLPSELILQR